MIYVFQNVQPDDGWRSIVIALLSALVALIGLIYRELNRRLNNLEASAKADFVPRKEYEAHREEIANAVARIEKAVDRRRRGD